MPNISILEKFDLRTCSVTLIEHGNYTQYGCPIKRWGGLMVSALYSGLRSPGSSPDQGTVLCFRARCYTFIVPLSTQVYKSVPANSMLGVTLQWNSIPSKGE